MRDCRSCASNDFLTRAIAILQNIFIFSSSHSVAYVFFVRKLVTIFLVQKFNPTARTTGLDFSKYSIDVIDPLLVKAHMKSRYRSGKSHYIFVLVDPAEIGRQAIVEYFCTCECGSRTVGCCSQIATIILGVWLILRSKNT